MPKVFSRPIHPMMADDGQIDWSAGIFRDLDDLMIVDDPSSQIFAPSPIVTISEYVPIDVPASSGAIPKRKVEHAADADYSGWVVASGINENSGHCEISTLPQDFQFTDFPRSRDKKMANSTSSTGGVGGDTSSELFSPNSHGTTETIQSNDGNDARREPNVDCANEKTNKGLTSNPFFFVFDDSCAGMTKLASLATASMMAPMDETISDLISGVPVLPTPISPSPLPPPSPPLPPPSPPPPPEELTMIGGTDVREPRNSEVDDDVRQLIALGDAIALGEPALMDTEKEDEWVDWQSDFSEEDKAIFLNMMLHKAHEGLIAEDELPFAEL